MAIRVWNDEYLSGFDQLDTQHKNLFSIINTFEEENDSSVKQDVIVNFVEQLIRNCEEHYKLEENMMESNNYPLMESHKKEHEEYLENLKEIFQLLRVQGIREPYSRVVDAATNGLHHMVRDDLTLFYYCRHKDFAINEEIIGKKCEIFTLENRLLGYGRISSFSDEDIVINCKHEYISLLSNDIIKISVSVNKQEYNNYIAKVNSLNGMILKLSRTAVVKTVNDREHYRIPVELEGRLWLEEKEPSRMRVLDISGGGLLCETDRVLAVGEEIITEFKLHDVLFTEKCRIVRSYKRNTTVHHYGMKFIGSLTTAPDNLLKHLLQLHTKQILKKYYSRKLRR